MTSAQGTLTWCGPGQDFSLNFTCTGPSCVDLDNFPESTCTSDGTTLTCTNGIVCPGPTNYTSDFTFSQSNVIVAQTQHIVLPDLCADIVLTSDGTTGGTQGSLTSTGPCGFGNSTTPGNSTSSTSSSSANSTTISSSTSTTGSSSTSVTSSILTTTSNSKTSNSEGPSSSSTNGSPSSLSTASSTSVTSSSSTTSKPLSTPGRTTGTPYTTSSLDYGLWSSGKSSSSSWSQSASQAVPTTPSSSLPTSRSQQASSSEWHDWVSPPQRTTCTKSGWLGGPSYSADADLPNQSDVSASTKPNQVQSWSEWSQPHLTTTPLSEGISSVKVPPSSAEDTTTAVEAAASTWQAWSGAPTSELVSGTTDTPSTLSPTAASPTLVDTYQSAPQDASSAPVLAASTALPQSWSDVSSVAAITSWTSPIPNSPYPTTGPSSNQPWSNNTQPGAATTAPVSPFKGFGPRTTFQTKSLFLPLLLILTFIIPTTLATASARPFYPSLSPLSLPAPLPYHNLTTRKLPPGWESFASDLAEYLSGKITTPEFASNLIAELEDAICDHASGVIVNKALGIDLVEACTDALIAGNLLVAPEAEFASLLGAGILCNLMIAPVLSGLTDEVSKMCKEPKPCSESLLTDAQNCGSCGNVCPAGTICSNGACTSNTCTGQTCSTFGPCGPGSSCVCASTTESTGFCVDGSTPCAGLANCIDSTGCASGEICAVNTCCGGNVCVGATFCGGGNGTALTSRSLSWKVLRRGERWEVYGVGSIGSLNGVV